MFITRQQRFHNNIRKANEFLAKAAILSASTVIFGFMFAMAI